jgi:subtilisin family serine protease
MNPSKPKAFANRRPKSKSIPKHTDGREYVVCLKDGIDYDAFWNEMETTIQSPHTVPDRAVRIADERLNMKRICNYILTDAEAVALRADSRVASVDIPVHHKDGIFAMTHATQIGNFNKPGDASAGTNTNWGLIRGNSKDNTYGTSNVAVGNYDYTLTGDGVDVVIMDTGIEATHPEFQHLDSSESRLQQIDWFDASDTAPDREQRDMSVTYGIVVSDSLIYLDDSLAKIRLGSADLSSNNVSVQVENLNRRYRVRYVGNSIWYRSALNDIQWEVSFLDNNWMEVIISRHDAATRVDLTGVVQTSGTSNIVIKNVNTSDLYEGQTIQFFNNNAVFYDYTGTIRHINGNHYAIDYLENPIIGNIDDLGVNLRLQQTTSIGGHLYGDCLITDVGPNSVTHIADGSTTRFLVAERPIDQRKIHVDVIGSLQYIYDNYNVVYDNGSTYIQFNYTPVETYDVNISFPPSLEFTSTSNCNEGPIRFLVRNGGGDTAIIDSIDSPTQITVSGYDGDNVSHGFANFFVGTDNDNPGWDLTNEYGDPILDLSDLADVRLFGPGATQVSFLLKTSDGGVNWTRQGGFGNNYRAVLVDGHWTAQAGLATASGSPLSEVLSDGFADYAEYNFNTPFTFKTPFTGFVPALHYTDIAGHGTHVAGIAAGKTYGWAKNANIYAIKLKDLSGNGGLSQDEAFSAIIGWHNNKTNGRPTVVNMSWGYGAYYADFDITGGSYRGLVWSDNVEKPEYGMGELGSFPIRDYGTDIGVEEMIEAGIHVCISSGNDGVKIDIPGGPDYHNYFLFTYGMESDFFYYQKGSSPYSRHALMVGSLDLTAYNAYLDQKVDYSNGGPGTDIYAAGTGILSSMSTVNTLADEGYTAAPYHLDDEYKQSNLSGTSMASPQLAGMVALWLQANPHATPADMKAWVLANAGSQMWDYNSNGMDYETANSPWGGATKVAYNKFNAANSLVIQNIVPMEYCV